MRIYNGKNSLIDLPLTNKVRLTIPAHSVSKEFMPSDDFLSMIVTAYKDTDIALIVSGPYELNLCAKNPVVGPMIAYTLDEAVIRFNGPAKVEGDKEEVKELIPEPEVSVKETEVEGEPDENPQLVEKEEEEEKVVEEEQPKTKKRSKKH